MRRSCDTSSSDKPKSVPERRPVANGAPRLAAFPKAYIKQLCAANAMSLDEWIELAAKLAIDGLEFYSGFADLRNPEAWTSYRRKVEDLGMCIPMLCCSPDFTHPSPEFRARQVDAEKHWIDMTAALGGSYCRVLSGQRRPDVSLADGVRYARECILACHEHAMERGVTLILENHYKDDFWQYPEFAQSMDVFCELVEAIDRADYPNFGVNYDPSNTYLAGEDPLELLERVKSRVVTMHASDRYLKSGTIEDLRAEETTVGYASRLAHGEIGQGLNDYDAIFRILRDAGFGGWISIEDGVDGFGQLQRSVAFLKAKLAG